MSSLNTASFILLAGALALNVSCTPDSKSETVAPKPNTEANWGTVTLSTSSNTGSPFFSFKVFGIGQTGKPTTVVKCVNYGETVYREIRFEERDAKGVVLGSAQITLPRGMVQMGETDLAGLESAWFGSVKASEGALAYSTNSGKSVCKGKVTKTTTPTGFEHLDGEIACTNLVGSRTSLGASRDRLDDLDIRISFKCDVEKIGNN